MSGSKNFARLAQELIRANDAGAATRQQRWRARQLMQKQQLLKNDEETRPEASPDDANDVKDKKDDTEGDGAKGRNKIVAVKLACACGDNCNFAIILANLSRVLWMAYEEYELLHACYADLYTEERRPTVTERVKIYWDVFVLNPKPAEPHRHAERLLWQCQEERATHLKEKGSLPIDPVAPMRRPLMSRLLDPFGCIKCRCLHCSNLDAVMDYRVALFNLLTEYCDLFEDYAHLFWASEVQLSDTGAEARVRASELGTKMLNLTLSELYTAMSFQGSDTNVMRSLSFVRDLIYR